MKIHYNPKLKELARQLRNNSTKSEIKLWKYLRNGQMFGYDFHRQKPIDNFIADFYCYQLRLVIELDGITHQDEEVLKKDALKEQKLNELGFTVVRFSDNQVMNDIENVIRTIENFILDFEEKKEN
jgi:very-short-patch-repair endonuclease